VSSRHVATGDREGEPAGASGPARVRTPRLRRVSLLAQRAALLLWQRLKRATGAHRTVYVPEMTAHYRSIWEGAARELSADFLSIGPQLWEVRLGERRTRIWNHMVQLDDPVTLRLSGDKLLTQRIAEAQGVPCPSIREVGLDHLHAEMARLRSEGGCVVVKPVSGSSGAQGVTTHITSPAQLRRALLLASLFSPRILVQDMVAGESCRLLLLQGRCLSAVRRRGVRVQGDGRSTLRELLSRAGVERVADDEVVRLTLEGQGASLADVPPSGLEILGRHLPAGMGIMPEPRTEYDESVDTIIHPDTVAAFRKVVEELGCTFASVDFVSFDVRKPLSEGGGQFIEVNTTPGIHHHCLPTTGGTAVARSVLAALLGM